MNSQSQLQSLIKAYLQVNPKPHSLQISNLACSIGVTANTVITTMASMISDIQCENETPPTEVLGDEPDSTDVLEDLTQDDVPTDDLVLNDGDTDPTSSEMSKQALLNDGALEDESNYEANNDLLMNDGAQFPATAGVKEDKQHVTDKISEALEKVSQVHNILKSAQADSKHLGDSVNTELGFLTGDALELHTALMVLKDDVAEVES